MQARDERDRCCVGLSSVHRSSVSAEPRWEQWDSAAAQTQLSNVRGATNGVRLEQTPAQSMMDRRGRGAVASSSFLPFCACVDKQLTTGTHWLVSTEIKVC